MKAPIRVLFVEDDNEMSAIYKENFLGPEFEITTAGNGREALDLVNRTGARFDVVVTDNWMPEMNGMNLLREIHQLHPDLKVILVTGYGNWSEYVDAHNLGVYRFLDKPVKMSELKGMIRGLFKEGYGPAQK